MLDIGGCGAPAQTGSSDNTILFEVTGRHDDNHDGRITDDPARAIRSADYQNDKSLRVLVLFITAEWCVPCRAEQPELVSIWQQSLATKAGVAVLEVLLQDAQGSQANQDTIDRWANTYRIPFDMAFDGNGALAGDYEPHVFPSQLVITTNDMNVRWKQSGLTSGALPRAVQAALNE